MFPSRLNNLLRIISTPSQFHSTTLSLINNAHKRISLSSLYIGASTQLEQQVVTALDSAVERGVNVEVKVDGNRMEREGTLHRPYVKGVEVKSKRNIWNGKGLIGEIMGVHHVKYLRADGEVMVGGWNWADSY